MDGKPLKCFPYPHQAIVGGDDRSLAIACASIFGQSGQRSSYGFAGRAIPRLRLAKKQRIWDKIS